MLAFGVIGAVLAEAGDPAQDAGSQPQQDCATCHVEVVATWQDSVHAQAYSDPIFQGAWESQSNNPECLACHTTGFVPRTGEFEQEGVTCKACHGDTPANHPPEPMPTDPGTDTCANCHPTTYEEWQQSAHGQQQLSCTTCHQPHPQTLRFESAKALCLNCHGEDARDDYVHLTHAERDCTDCHWHRAEAEDLLAHFESGALFPTGHTTEVQTRACVTCHEEITTSDLVSQGEAAVEELGPASEHPLFEAQVRITELEAEVDTVRAQGENTSALRLVQGAIVGLVIGGIVVFGVIRFRARNRRIIQSDHVE
jgi:hypothetical protein